MATALIPLEHLCAARCESIDQVRALIRGGVLPEPPQRLADGTELVPPDFLSEADDPLTPLRDSWQHHLDRELRRFRMSQVKVLTTFTSDRRRQREQQLMRMGSTAWGVALSLLMQERVRYARKWFDRAAVCYRRSLADADAGNWGRSIGSLKARVISRDEPGILREAEWTLDLGAASAGSPTATYAACLSYMALGEDARAASLACQLHAEDSFPKPVAETLVAISSKHERYERAIVGVLESFETRTRYLEDIPVADTVIVLQLLAAPHGLDTELESSLLPRSSANLLKAAVEAPAAGSVEEHDD